MNWREYLQSENPVAAALLSKMNYTDEEKVQVKKEFLRMIVKMELNPARARFILGFFERYITLNEREEETLMKEIKRMDESKDIMHLPISWEEKGIEKGIEEGIEKGIETGIEKVALEMLKEGLSIELIMKVTSLEQKRLDELKKRLDE